MFHKMGCFTLQYMGGADLKFSMYLTRNVQTHLESAVCSEEFVIQAVSYICFFLSRRINDVKVVDTTVSNAQTVCVISKADQSKDILSLSVSHCCVWSMLGGLGL